MELNSTFSFEGWNIRYAILSSMTTRMTNEASRAKSVLFVHGTPWSSTVFQPTIDALLATGMYQILVYDLPGYGASQHYDTSATNVSVQNFPGDTSVRFQAKALTALLDRVNKDYNNCMQKVDVIAHDIGGAIILRTHLMHGVGFNSMMFVDTNTVLPWGDGFYKLARSTPNVFREFSPNIHEAIVRAVIQSASYKPEKLKPYWEDILAKPWLDSPRGHRSPGERQESFIRQIAQANDADVKEMLSENMYERVNCRVKILWAEEDQWIPRYKIEELVDKLKSSQVETSFIPEAGHLVMLDQPERFAIEVLGWLR